MEIMEDDDTYFPSAKHMSKRIPPSLPHLRLGENSRPSISDLRTQSSADRVTTAEAVALLFEDMQVKEEETKKLWEWIKQRINAGAAQSGRKADGAYTVGKKEKQLKKFKKDEEQKKKIQENIQQETTS